MSRNINELCKDPLFQLNLAIWLAQPQIEHFHIHPLFYKSGLSIYSIGPLLALPPDIRLAVSEKLDCQEGARPDLVLETKATKKFCILECKTSSFGPSSTKPASQARALLLIAGPILSEVLGLGTRRQNEGILCYFSGSNQIKMMENTLGILAQEIDGIKLESGEYGCFGVKLEQSTILLEYSDRIKKFLNFIEDSPVKILTFEAETDPRPLYFIPYDPNIQQTKEEQELCRRILFERILSYIISKIGGVTIPSSIIFAIEEILNSATFGVYEVWEDNETKKHIRRLVREFLEDIRSRMDEELREHINYESKRGWTFNLKDTETYEEMLKQISKFKPETLDLSKELQPTLFDDIMEN